MESDRPAARRRAVEALRMASRGDPLEEAMKRAFPAELRGADRRLAGELVHGVLRHRGELDWLIDRYAKRGAARIRPALLEILRVSLYQILFLDRVPPFAAVHEGVTLAKGFGGDRAGGFANALLREVLRAGETLPWPSPDPDLALYLSVMRSHPRWLVDRWLARFGSTETIRLLEWNNRIPPLEVRVNTLTTSPAEFAAACEARGIAALPGRLFPEAFRFDPSPSIEELPGYEKGWFWVQGEGGMIPALLLDPRPGKTILDLCAAPGGKSLFLAALMGGKGRIVAVERKATRAATLKTNLYRCGARMVEPLVADGRTLAHRFGGTFDRILLDAPCSGTGVLGKKIEVRWQKNPDDLRRHAILQRELLEGAIPLLKPGGILVYSTCSLEPEENADLLAAFLPDHPELTVDPPPSRIRDLLSPYESPDPFPHWETFPPRDGIDGFFAARFRNVHNPAMDSPLSV